MNRISYWFPILAVALSVVAFCFPEVFVGQKAAIVPLLMIVMLGMGLTLSWTDFIEVGKRPLLILLGVGIQYLLMPLIAFGVGKILRLPDEWIVGMVLVGSVAGGTASNVICHLSGGWVALSVSMTLVSTLVSLVATPLLTWLYLGQSVDVPMVAMILSIFKIVILPVGVGVLINTRFKRFCHAARRFSPLVSVGGIVWIIAIIVALNTGNLNHSIGLVVLAVMIHNLLGLSLGYWITKLVVRDARIARTIAIEVGMQNSGMAVVLANQFFTVGAALPGAIFSIWHNISGSILSAIWTRKNGDSPEDSMMASNDE